MPQRRTKAHHRKKNAEPDASRRSTRSTTNTSSTRGGSGRGIWSGTISFGLLQIPVTLYSVERRTEEIHFRLLDKHDLSPIRYERVSTTTGKPVDWRDIVKGYEIEKNNFIVLEPEELAKANVQATRTIDIQDFIPKDRIDPRFFETPYFVVPEPRATKAYVLLREALQRKGAAAIATFVLRTREHLVALMPAKGALMLEVLRFGHELRDATEVPLPSDDDAGAINDRELTMAEQLIDGMMSDWEPSRYRDRYHQDVMTIVEEKAKTGAVKEHHVRSEGTVAHDVVDLLELLKKSIEKSGRAANDAQAAPKRRAPRARRTRPTSKVGKRTAA